MKIGKTHTLLCSLKNTFSKNYRNILSLFAVKLKAKFKLIFAMFYFHLNSETDIFTGNKTLMCAVSDLPCIFRFLCYFKHACQEKKLPFIFKQKISLNFTKHVLLTCKNLKSCGTIEIMLQLKAFLSARMQNSIWLLLKYFLTLKNTMHHFELVNADNI